MPIPLIKTTIPFGPCGHFSQVGPSENSCFPVMLPKFGPIQKILESNPCFPMPYRHAMKGQNETPLG
jgi:hypothetical protein